ncbi:MAG: carbamoyltransferase [Myxococcota bacterium]
MNVLGISALYHDSAACLVRDGEIIAAAQEERFSRTKNDARFPMRAIQFCLEYGAVGPREIDRVVFYEKPLTTFERLLDTYLTTAPHGYLSFRLAMPQWLRSKLWTRRHVRQTLKALGFSVPRDILYAEHHQSHAASAFYPSPFESAAVVTLDGVGEWATTTIGHGQGSRCATLRQIEFPHSLGLLYSAFTAFCGFRVNSGEYKLMGLAPFGEPRFVDAIYRHLIDLKEDGSFRLDPSYFGFLTSARMTNPRFAELFGGPPRNPNDPISDRERDLARSVQQVTEEVVLRIARQAKALTGERRLCLAGGVALNCVANGRLLETGEFDEIWVQPAAGDAGGALGAALCGYYDGSDAERRVGASDSMKGARLGPGFQRAEIERELSEAGLEYQWVDESSWARAIAAQLVQGKTVGMFAGRMEFGPRALGNRSILADPRSVSTRDFINKELKGREMFRPLAPAVLEEHCQEFFALSGPSPYMTFAAPVVSEHLAAVTHVDRSARIQTVGAEEHPRFYAVLKAFYAETSIPVLLNTSFNVRDEPIVCSPNDAIRCFLDTPLDVLVLENAICYKPQEP